MELIIINQAQFGYHIDTYYYCKYLKNKFHITYICWDQGLPKIQISGVQIFYIKRTNNLLIRAIQFLKKSIKQINNKRAIVFIKYFKGFSLILRFLKPSYCIVMDIRTASVNRNAAVRVLQDTLLKFESLFFKHITIISQSLSEKLGLAHKAYVIPIGADVISSSRKSFNSLHLLYIGTLYNRNIDATIHGFKMFYDEFHYKIKTIYTIIGSGPNNEKQSLSKLVAHYNLTKNVKIAGSIPHNKLKSWFDDANVGISYVPLTSYYDCQPVTKTYEYLMSGMPVVATKTSENMKIIKPENGVLIGDTYEDFYAGLKSIFINRKSYDSKIIQNMTLKYSWGNIIMKNLKVYLERISN